MTTMPRIITIRVLRTRRARRASPLQSRHRRITSNFKLPTCAKRIAPLHIWAPPHPRPRALTVPLGAGSRMRQMAQNKKTTTQPRRITAKRMALRPWGQVGSNSSRKYRYFQLPTSNFQLPTSNFQLPTSNFQLPTEYVFTLGTLPLYTKRR